MNFDAQKTLSEELVYLVRRYHAIHEDVVTMYVSKAGNISAVAAKNLIHKAVIAHLIDEQDTNFGKCFVESIFYKVTSMNMQMSRAIRISMEFMGLGETTFFHQRVMDGNDATTLLFVQNPPDEKELESNAHASSRIVQIGYIENSNELPITTMMATKPVPKDMRSYVIRIAAVEPGFHAERCLKAGYYMFIRFQQNMFTFMTSDITVTEKESRWDDVKE